MIELTFRQKISAWNMKPFYKNLAINMCEEYSTKLNELTSETKERVWNSIINDPEIDIIFRYYLEKDHKEHFVRSYK